jgi:murein DD-endopeptidase MepM/ murein hydrolase activator NlpD
MPQAAVVRPCRGTEDVGVRCSWRLSAPVRALAAAGVATAAVLAPAAIGTASAQAQSGGTAPAPKAPAVEREPAGPAPTANLYGRPAPRIKRVTCRTACAAAAVARPGSLVRVAGRHLKAIDEVLFLGSDADAADDTSVAPRRARRRALVARVPRTAVSGRIAVALRDGTRSPATAEPLTIEAAPATIPPGVVDAEAQGHKVFFDSQRQAELSYVVGGSEPVDVLVELIRGSDGAAIAQWTPGEVQPGVPQTVEWDGTADGVVQRDGVYQFRVTATDAAGTRAMSSQEPAEPVDPETPAAFTFLGYRFPVQGAHGYGEVAAGFGGGRGHQGQDVFAACGTPVVAARGGTVKFKEYHSRAGHYLVLDGARTRTDFVYMHLRDAPLVDKGAKVKTGQLIGFVGATGRASGCHLHFEEWTAPGWYDGGKAFDPLPHLRAWDQQS